MLAFKERLGARLQGVRARCVYSRTLLPRLTPSAPCSPFSSSFSRSVSLFRLSPKTSSCSWSYVSKASFSSSSSVRPRVFEDEDSVLPGAPMDDGPPDGLTPANIEELRFSNVVADLKANETQPAAADAIFARQIVKICQNKAPTIGVVMKFWRAWAEYPGARPTLETAKVVLATRFRTHRSTVPFLSDLKASGLLDTQDLDLVQLVIRGCVLARSLSETLGCLESLFQAADSSQHQEILVSFLRSFSEAGDIPGTLLLFEEWRQRGMPMTPTAYLHVAVAYTMAGNVSGALDVLAMDGSGCTAEHYIELQKAAAAARQVDGVLEIFEVLNSKGLPLPASCYMTACVNYVKKQELEQAVMCYQQARVCPEAMQGGLKHVSYVFLLKGLSHADSDIWLERCFELLKTDIALCRTLTPEQRSTFWLSNAAFTTVMSQLYRRNREADSIWLFEQMMNLDSHGRITPNTPSFNTVLAWSSGGRAQDLLRVCDLMKEYNVRPDHLTYSLMLKLMKADTWRGNSSPAKAHEAGKQLMQFLASPFFDLARLAPVAGTGVSQHFAFLLKLDMYEEFRQLFDIVRGSVDVDYFDGFAFDYKMFDDAVALCGSKGDFVMFSELLAHVRKRRSLPDHVLGMFFQAWAKAHRTLDQQEFLPFDLLAFYPSVEAYVQMRVANKSRPAWQTWSDIFEQFLKIRSVEGALWTMARALENSCTIQTQLVVSLVNELISEEKRHTFDGDVRFRGMVACIDVLLGIQKPAPPKPGVLQDSLEETNDLSRSPGGYFVDEDKLSSGVHAPSSSSSLSPDSSSLLPPQQTAPISSSLPTEQITRENEALSSPTKPSASSSPPEKAQPPAKPASPPTPFDLLDLSEIGRVPSHEVILLNTAATNSRAQTQKLMLGLRNIFVRRLDWLGLNLDTYTPFTETWQLHGVLEFLHEYRREIPHQAELATAFYAISYNSPRANPDLACYTTLFRLISSFGRRGKYVPSTLPPGGSPAFMASSRMQRLTPEHARRNVDKLEKSLRLAQKGMEAQRIKLPLYLASFLVQFSHQHGITFADSSVSRLQLLIHAAIDQPTREREAALNAYMGSPNKKLFSPQLGLQVGLDLLHLLANQASSSRVWEVFGEWAKSSPGLETDERIRTALYDALKLKQDAISNGPRFIALLQSSRGVISRSMVCGFLDQLRAIFQLARSTFESQPKIPNTEIMNTYAWVLPSSPADITQWLIQLHALCKEHDCLQEFRASAVCSYFLRYLFFCVPPHTAVPLFLQLHHQGICMSHRPLECELAPYKLRPNINIFVREVVRTADLTLLDATITGLNISPERTSPIHVQCLYEAFKLISRQGESYRGSLPTQLLQFFPSDFYSWPDVLPPCWDTTLKALSLATGFQHQPMSYFTSLLEILKHYEDLLTKEFPSNWESVPEVETNAPLGPEEMSQLCTSVQSVEHRVKLIRFFMRQTLFTAFSKVTAPGYEHPQDWMKVVSMHADWDVKMFPYLASKLDSRLRELPFESTFVQVIALPEGVLRLHSAGNVLQRIQEDMCMLRFLCHLVPSVDCQRSFFDIVCTHFSSSSTSLSTTQTSISSSSSTTTAVSSSPTTDNSSSSISVPAPAAPPSTCPFDRSSAIYFLSRISPSHGFNLDESLLIFYSRLPSLSVQGSEFFLDTLTKVCPSSITAASAPIVLQAIKHLLKGISSPRPDHLVLALQAHCRVFPSDPDSSKQLLFQALPVKVLRRKEVQHKMECLLQMELVLPRGSTGALWKEALRGDMTLDERLLRLLCEHFMNENLWDQALAVVERWGQAVLAAPSIKYGWQPLRIAFKRIAMHFLRHQEVGVSRKLFALKIKLEEKVYGPDYKQLMRSAKQLVSVHSSAQYPTDGNLLESLVLQAGLNEQ